MECGGPAASSPRRPPPVRVLQVLRPAPVPLELPRPAAPAAAVVHSVGGPGAVRREGPCHATRGDRSPTPEGSRRLAGGKRRRRATPGPSWPTVTTLEGSRSCDGKRRQARIASRLRDPSGVGNGVRTYPGVARLRRLPPANLRDPSGVGADSTTDVHRRGSSIRAVMACAGLLPLAPFKGRGMLGTCARQVPNMSRTRQHPS
jgi:hypothetical protein